MWGWVPEGSPPQTHLAHGEGGGSALGQHAVAFCFYVFITFFLLFLADSLRQRVTSVTCDLILKEKEVIVVCVKIYGANLPEKRQNSIFYFLFRFYLAIFLLDYFQWMEVMQERPSRITKNVRLVITSSKVEGEGKTKMLKLSSLEV